MLRQGRLCLLADLLKVLLVLPAVEWGRRTEGPEPLLHRLRSGARNLRNDEQRERLQRVIRWVDARIPGGPNCYRRVLLETALDVSAASEQVIFGMRAGGKAKSGHVWLEPWRDGDERYEVEIAL